MRSYRELTRRGRLHRFRELAGLALDAYGLAGERLSFVQYGKNVIYRVDAGSPAVTDGSLYV